MSSTRPDEATQVIPPAANMLGRTEVASFATYPEAQAAVDRLSDDGFPVERLTIVGRGLRLVEQITGRRGWKEAILSTMVTGLFVGAGFGFFFGLFDWVEPLESGLVLAINGAIYGVLVGAAFGALTHWMSAGRRDFSSRESMEAESYVLLCDAAQAGEAARLLERQRAR